MSNTLNVYDVQPEVLVQGQYIYPPQRLNVYDVQSEVLVQGQYIYPPQPLNVYDVQCEMLVQGQIRPIGALKSQQNREILGDSMYPKNAASPPTIAIGALVNISSGILSISGAGVTVTPQGGSETAGGGTLSCSSTTSIWYYTPTQAETNYSAFTVTVYQSGYVPVSQTIVTTNTATAGMVNVGAINSVAASNVTTVSAYVGNTGAAINGTNVNTLAGHDPGATLGTSTYAGADTAGTTTLLARILGTLAAGTHNPQSGDTYALAKSGGAGVTIGADQSVNVDKWGGAGLPTSFAASNMVTLPSDYLSSAEQMQLAAAAAISPPSAASIAAAVWTLANAIEGVYTPTQVLEWLLAVLAGRIADVGGATEHYKDPTNTTQRVAVTFDSSKNRTAVSLT